MGLVYPCLLATIGVFWHYWQVPACVPLKTGSTDYLSFAHVKWKTDSTIWNDVKGCVSPFGDFICVPWMTVIYFLNWYTPHQYIMFFSFLYFFSWFFPVSCQLPLTEWQCSLHTWFRFFFFFSEKKGPWYGLFVLQDCGIWNFFSLICNAQDYVWWPCQSWLCL